MKSVLIKFVRRDDDFMIIKTIARDKKYPDKFYTFASKLEEAIKGEKEIIDRDGRNFACFRYDKKRDFLYIYFTWLQEGLRGNVVGHTEEIYISNPQRIIDWYRWGDKPVYSVLNQNPCRLPEIVFDETGREQLRKVIENPAIRRKFVKAIRWRLIPGYVSKIIFSAETIPYSFFWVEKEADGTIGMAGGLILHNFNPETRSGCYSFHT